MPGFGRGEDRPRTAADRDAARLERERKRALREGRPPPEELTPADEHTPPDDSEANANGAAPVPEQDAEPDQSSWEPFAHEPDPEPIPSAREREPERDGEPAAPAPEPLPPPADPEPAVAHDDPPTDEQAEPIEAAPRARRTVSLPRPQTDDMGHHTDAWDKPIGTVRRSRADYQPQPGASGMPPHRSIGVPSKRRRRWAKRLFAVLAILFLAAIAVFAVLLFQPFHSKGYDAVVVRIPPGSSTSEIGDLLADKGVVDSGFFFQVRARLGGDRGKIRAGTYTLKKSMSYSDALAALTASPKAAPTIDITLPEGPSRRELAERVQQAGIRGSYVAASAHSGLLDPRDYGAPKGTKTLEGFLFPDTYQLASGTATSKRLVDDQLKTFKREFAKVDLKQAKRRDLSRYDVVTIASMIEREALVPKDRRLISAVIYNRLRRGMPLGIDATLRYRLNNWSSPLKQSELNKNSDYNTRKVQGLPPTPIGNPGLASLKAAAHPANVDYLYYVRLPDHRHHYFTANYQDFLNHGG